MGQLIMKEYKILDRPWGTVEVTVSEIPDEPEIAPEVRVEWTITSAGLNPASGSWLSAIAGIISLLARSLRERWESIVILYGITAHGSDSSCKISTATTAAGCVTSLSPSSIKAELGISTGSLVEYLKTHSSSMSMGGLTGRAIVRGLGIVH